MGDNWYYICTIAFNLNRFVGVKVIVLVSNAVERGFELRSSQTNDYKIGICFFSAKPAALRSKSKFWLAQNQDNVERHVYPPTAVFFKSASTVNIQLSVLI